MKTNKILIGSLTMTVALAISSCSTGRQIAYKDDVYNNRQINTDQAYQSPDYYYTEDEYAQQNNAYYTDEYSDDEYYEDEYGDLEYANRINRFYYSTPGMSYYDPFFDPWFGFNTRSEEHTSELQSRENLVCRLLREKK